MLMYAEWVAVALCNVAMLSIFDLRFFVVEAEVRHKAFHLGIRVLHQILVLYEAESRI